MGVIHGQVRVLVAIALIAIASTARAEPDARADELSEQCGKLVARLFQDNWGDGKTTDGGARGRFEGHYNRKLNKCFLLRTVSGVYRNDEQRRNVRLESEQLFDANENKNYGQFGNYHDNLPLTCWVQGTRCRSKEEWDRLIKPFMEE